MRILFILVVAVLNVCLTEYLIENPDFYQLDAYTWENDDFRAMKLGNAVASLDQLNMDALTTAMIEWEYDMTGADRDDAASISDTAIGNRKSISDQITDGIADSLGLETNLIEKRKPAEYRKLRNAYALILGDLRYFPIPTSIREDTPEITYENGWMDRRTYGGERGHEGCDIMGNERPRGYYPVVSISDGVVEKVGWLEKGGWRIGIRTPSGLYIYYAHLYDYARDWREGDEVRAGELLGFMGDTGYSAVPGTVGNFEVHLHMGMYLKTDHYDELSINPYWILRYLEKCRLKYDY